ncbi:hypothetical protein [Reyranella sp.]|uniref:hypothetical protein n=1 Tax=Reyranella sp. TaxID=1929291 RepID=UPI003784718C
MTDQPLPFSPPTRARTWLVTMTDGKTRTVSATACRVEHGCLLFSEPAGMTMALAAGEWRQVEQEPAQ